MKKRKRKKHTDNYTKEKKRSEIELIEWTQTYKQTKKKKKRMSTLIFHKDLFNVFSKYTNKRKTSLCVIQYEFPR
jgi:hypothetical protein